MNSSQYRKGDAICFFVQYEQYGGEFFIIADGDGKEKVVHRDYIEKFPLRTLRRYMKNEMLYEAYEIDEEKERTLMEGLIKNQAKMFKLYHEVQDELAQEYKKSIEKLIEGNTRLETDCTNVRIGKFDANRFGFPCKM